MMTLARIAGLCPGSPLTKARVEALCTRARYPIEKIRRELAYEHPVTMEEGLDRVVEVLSRRRSA
jgi:hypothetical protein